MRWAYIKNGDVAAQLKHLGAERYTSLESGPDAFLSDFLVGIKGCPALLLSWGQKSNRFDEKNKKAICYRVSGSRLGKAGNFALRWRASFLGLRELIKFRPERLICGRVGPMLWVTALFSTVCAIPFIHSRHNSLYEDQSRWYQRLFARFDFIAIRKARAVISHGPFLSDQMRSIGVPSSRVIEFDVGFSDFQRMGNLVNSEVHQREQVEKTIIFVGRVDQNKGVFDLLEAVEPLLRANQDVSVVYVGAGPSLEKLKGKVASIGLQDQIEFTGRVAHEELPMVMGRAHVIVTPTQRAFPEGRCMAAMEALALGIPVIAPDAGPFPYLVESGVNGFLYDADSVESLSACLDKSISDAIAYQKVLTGAAASADKLRQPVRTFFQAVELAFRE